MADETPVALASAAAAIDVAASAQAQQIAAEVVEQVVEQAQERVEAAGAAAQQLADAAMQTELGRRVSANEERVNECLSRSEAAVSELRNSLALIQSEVSSMSEKMAAAIGAAAATQLQLTPQPSEVVATEPTVETIIPTEPLKSAVEESRAVEQAAVKRVRRWT